MCALFIALELHSNCIICALVLHSLVNCPSAIIDCTICKCSCTCVSLSGKFPQGQYVLHYVCTLVCTICALVLHSFITLQSFLHSNCTRFALFINVALELHSDCTLFKRCTLCCTLCCTRCCILFAIVLHCVCTLWSIPPRQ